MPTPPSATDTLAFRQTMGLFATGVTVVATITPQGESIGMTVSAVAPLSLDPMLVLVCVERRASLASRILQTAGFSICILGEDQEALSDHFAGRRYGNQPPSFVFREWIGGPLLEGCIAGLGCTKYQVIEGGDHWIFIGQVVALHRQNDPPDPLIFYRSHYRRLKARET